MKKILCITPGPIMSESGFLKQKAISKHYSITLITSSNIEQLIGKHNYSGIDYHGIDRKWRKGFLPSFDLIVYALRFCFSCRLKKIRYDLVVTYDPLKTGIIGVLCAFILKSKFAPEINGVYTSPYEYMDDSQKISTRIKKKIYPIIESLVIRQAHGIKLLFPDQIKPFKKILKSKIIHDFFNLVDIKPFIDTSSSVENDEILFIGFPFYRKGVDILIDAFRIVYLKYPGWRLKILGWYPDQSLLKTHIANHPGIDYIPPKQHKEIPQIMASCSIFVLPSRSEAMGRVLIESMAAGKPRIGTDVDGIPTVIENGVDGLLFRSQDVNDLVEKIIILINDPELRKKLGANAKIRALTEFNENCYFSKLNRFYNEVMENNE